MALSLFWLCWNDSPNDKKFISNDKQVTLFERKFERRRPLLHASAYYVPCRGDDPRAAVAENGVLVCRSGPLTYTLCPNVYITNFAHVEAFMAKPEFVDVFCRVDSRFS